MLWLALSFPQLALDLLERADPEARETPLAICDRLSLLVVNEPGRLAGLRPGMKRATGQALSPTARWYDYDAKACTQALHTLAGWALQFTPSVSFAPPPYNTGRRRGGGKRPRAGKAGPTQTRPGQGNARSEEHSAGLVELTEHGKAGLLLEIAPSLKLFQGLDNLLAQLGQGIHALGYSTVAGIAPNPGAAWLFAQEAARQYEAQSPHRSGTSEAPALRPFGEMRDAQPLQDRLAGLPIEHLSEALDHANVLHTMGARRIGQLLELPRAGLARRFGKNLLLELDCALGLQPQPLSFFESPTQFESRLELMADIETTEPLLFGANRLLLELGGWLRGQGAGLRCFDLIVEHHHPPETSVSVRLTNPSRDPERLLGLLRERLNLLTLRAPVHTLRIRCHETFTLADNNQELFANPISTQESLGRLLERLQVRLGRNQVQRLMLAEDHRPEAAYRICVIDSLEQIGKTDPPAPKPRNAVRSNTEQHQYESAVTALHLAAGQSDPGGHLPRPLWLLRSPQALSERNSRPWLHSTLTVLAGPERIETGWWDNHLIQRDYFVAEDTAHHLYWIYRERHAHEQAGWFVHGRFG